MIINFYYNVLLNTCFSTSFEDHLIITLEEPGRSPTNNILVQISDSAANHSRRINLVPGHTFHLHCEAGGEENTGGHGNSLDAVWYSGDNEVTVSSASDPNRPTTYSYLDGNRLTLVLTDFRVGYVGVYRCRERGTSNMEGAAIVIGASK